ncbi:ImmA/IrrE family metallo-endopeptidase [Tahibacter sp. UC22_41]|uniref:ImmA/IrrE family metallo-endopeptidase n=1 Tax=Tahibacter sp. UC22_41 TaxID=3350178 RepID=UPI0036DD8C05
MLTNAEMALAKRKAAHPLPARTREVRLDVAQRLGVDVDDLPPDSDRAEPLLHILLESVPEPVRGLIKARQVVVGEVSAPGPGAHVYSEGGGFVVVLHSELFEFLFRIVRAFSSALFRAEGSEPQHGIELPRLARVIAEIFFWYERYNIVFGSDYDITIDQIKLGGLITRDAELFLLAHELSHVIVAVGRSDGRLRQELSATDEESFADAIAVQLLMSSVAQPVHGFRLALCMAGVEVALQIWRILAMLGVSVESGVHPPSETRLGVIRGACRRFFPDEQSYEAAAQIADVFEKVFDRVAEIILNPAEQAAVYAAEAADLIDRIHRLIGECSAGESPDYFRFMHEMSVLLDEGYPEMVIEKVFNTYGRALFDPSTKDLPATEQKKIFFGYKLLFRLTQETNDPAFDVLHQELTKFSGAAQMPI